MLQLSVLSLRWWWCFSSRERILVECSTTHSPPALFILFFLVEFSTRTLIPLFRPGSVHSGSASWDDCDRVFPDELRVSSLPDRFSHYAWTAVKSAHSDFVESKVYACLGVTCHMNFWQNDRGLLSATAVTRGWNGHRIRVSTQSWLWRRKSLAAPVRIRTRNLSITSPALLPTSYPGYL